ncbi:hypothetical protein [Leptothrix ochracea]|uniref:hypothetical protein n=1 Tax=Leptothrix ochracea TaxID=735331 RepID=UPI0034E1D7CD
MYAMNKYAAGFYVLPALVLVNLSGLLIYFVLFYFLSKPFVSLVAGLLIPSLFVIAIVSFLIKPTKIKLVFFSPLIVVLFLTLLGEKTYYACSRIEYEFRVNDFLRSVDDKNKRRAVEDLKWNANVFNDRYFLYSENNHQEGTVDDPQNKECKKITKKLDGNFFLVTSTNCGL